MIKLDMIQIVFKAISTALLSGDNQLIIL